MIVIYRLCGIPSTNPSPILQEDKFKLNKLCLDSFVMAFTGCDIKVVFLCDFCDESLYRPLLDSVPFEKEIYFSNIGINNTMLLSYDIASEQDDDILFQECDYLYLPQSGQKMINAIKHFGLVSPYDHKNFYVDKSIHSGKTDIELFEDHHFRTTERNTMTFGMTKKVFERNYESLERWGYLDNEVWKEMRVNGDKLWIPIPSFATHMVKDFLAPGIDWQQLWKILMTK